MPTVLDRLNDGLQQVMLSDNRVYLLGEDILDPYGGAFKVTRGLSSQFPDRVLTSPISESAIIGICNGMALRGLHPVAEIMFGDFVTLIADQLINHAAKFRWMYNEQVRVPVVVRTPMGGRRGYGPTHSQSLEKLFLGIPGLQVIAPNSVGDPAELLMSAIRQEENPIIFIEHKLLYTRPMLEPGSSELQDWVVTKTDGLFPTYSLRIAGAESSKITIATYGYNFELARAAALELAYEHEMFTEIILFSQLSPFELSPLFDSLRRTRRLITVEEGTFTLGWGAEVAAQVAEGVPQAKIQRVAALNLPIANAKSLEDAILPSQEKIVHTALEMVK